MTESYTSTLTRLKGAQKGAARSAPAYSRFVNRRLGRYLAAWAYGRGLSPNQVTGVSAAFTFTGIALLALVQPSWWLGVTISLLFVLGYAFDSADGQVARLTGTGSPAGEWLDHVVDATKIVAQPLALAVSFYRFGTETDAWLLVPLLNAVVGSVLFFAMILTEQLRRAQGVTSKASEGGRLPWLRSLLVLPTDYGVLCLSFLLLGATTAFSWVYAAITAGLLGFVVLALPKWFREIAALGRGATGQAPARPEAVTRHQSVS
jgi:phosphatidylglycerophosphate synthase